MPAAEVEITTAAAEKEIETIPEKSKTNCEGKASEETKTADESIKTTKESENTEKRNFRRQETEKSRILPQETKKKQPVWATLRWKSRWRINPRRRLRERWQKISNESQRTRPTKPMTKIALLRRGSRRKKGRTATFEFFGIVLEFV